MHMRQERHRRIAALICLMALVAFNAVSTIHTDGSARPNVSGTTIRAYLGSGSDHCAACEFLTNGTGSWILACAVVVALTASLACKVSTVRADVACAVIISNSPRAPPAN
jgi:hypothetical protein